MAARLPQASLQSFRVGHVPSVFYVPDYVTEREEEQLLRQVYEAPATKWKNVTNRRLQNWGGVVHEKGLIAERLPWWLVSLTERLHRDVGLFPSPINHVLVNEYSPGQGIMAHQDGPLYYPVVAILSLGSSAVMKFSPHSRLQVVQGMSATSPPPVHTAIPDRDSKASHVEGAGEREDLDQRGQDYGAWRDTQPLASAVAAFEMHCLSDRSAETPRTVEEPTLLLGAFDELKVHAINDHVQTIGADQFVHLEPRSLLVFSEHAYNDYLHGIENSILFRSTALTPQEPHSMTPTESMKATSINTMEMDEDSPVESRTMERWRADSSSDVKRALASNSTRVSLTCRVVKRAKLNLMRL